MYKFVQVWLKPLYSNRVSIWSVFVRTTYKYCVQILTKNTTYKYWPNTDPIWLEGFQPNQYVLSVFWSVFVHTYCVHSSTCTFLIHTCTKWNMSWRYLYISVLQAFPYYLYIPFMYVSVRICAYIHNTALYLLLRAMVLWIVGVLTWGTSNVNSWSIQQTLAWLNTYLIKIRLF